jgi:NAD(P)-dependent dehydrogenase (short-subunit alcohol dehydrogenase family)
LNGTILIYGATSYTGKLIAKVAGNRGARSIVAGRNFEKVEAVAKPVEITEIAGCRLAASVGGVGNNEIGAVEMPGPRKAHPDSDRAELLHERRWSRDRIIR